MSFDKQQFLAPGEGVTYYLERLHPPTAVYLKNMGAANLRFKMATGDLPDRFVDDVAPAALTVGPNITFTQGSVTVTGVGTLFLAEVAVGDTLILANGLVLALVHSVDSNTQITLETPWTGATITTAVVFNATPAWRVLGPMDEQLFFLPLAPDGTTPGNRHYMFFQGLEHQMRVGLYSPGNDRITVVRSTLTENFVAP